MSPPWLWAPTTGLEEDSEELAKLSQDEELLSHIYMERHRPDLAECIRQSPKQRLLLEPILGVCKTIESIRRFRRAFGEDQEGITMPETLAEWTAECLEIFKDDPGLAQFTQLSEDLCVGKGQAVRKPAPGPSYMPPVVAL